MRTRERALLFSLALIAIGIAAFAFANNVKISLPAFAGVIIGIFSLGFGCLLLINSIGGYFGLNAEKLDSKQEYAEIQSYIDDLLKSIGGPIYTVKPEVLKTLFKRKEYPKMLGWIKNYMRLELRVGLRIVEKNNDQHPMWIEFSKPIPTFGTDAFKNTRVVINATRDIIDTQPFDWIVAGFAHELSHVVLFSIGHKLQNEEKAVDLTAMILGFEDFMVNAKHTTSETASWLGYLTVPEREFAHRYLKTFRPG